MNIVFLPSTAPDDETYGLVPETVHGFTGVSVYTLVFPSVVWYNQQICDIAIEQIRSYGLSDIVLVGFSKSGLGAWNITRRIPDLVRATMIFDAPVALETLPDWGTASFYDSDASWQKDLPVMHIEEFEKAVTDNHRLILISGQGFHDDMCRLSDKLTETDINYSFLPREQMKHHWNSGWIEEGLKAIMPVA